LGPEGDKYDTWDCQIHLIESKMFDETKITGVKSKLTPEKRLAILRLKYWANLVNKKLRVSTDNNFKIYSPSIYEAVLERNITSTDDFIADHRKSVPEKFIQIFDSATRQVEKAI